MSIQAKYVSRIDVVETLSDTFLGTDNKVTYDGGNTERAINASTTIPATKFSMFTKSMVTGAATIDLTSLVGTNGAAVNATGLKLQVAKFINSSANAIQIEPGASNGYNIFGASSLFVLAPGQEVLFFGNEATPDVGSGAKTIDISGTGTQSLKCFLVFG